MGMWLSLRANLTPYFCSIFWLQLIVRTYLYLCVSIYFFISAEWKLPIQQKKNPFHRDEPYKDISREEYMRQQPTFFLLYPHGEGGKGDSLVKVEGGSLAR